MPAPSAIKTLSALAISQGTLAPTFASGTYAYAVGFYHSVTAITVTPTVTDTGLATVKVNGVLVTSGAASASIPLAAGVNTITVQVIAEDLGTQNYVITATRAATGEDNPGVPYSPTGDRIGPSGEVTPVAETGATAVGGIPGDQAGTASADK